MSSPDPGGPTARSCDYIADRTAFLLDRGHTLLLAILLGLTALALAGLLVTALLAPVPTAYVEAGS